MQVWTVKSAEQLSVFVRHVLLVFREAMPQAHVEERWAQVALQLALSCSSRHYAGRSLQIFRALRVPITARMLVDILSRLVETAAEQGEDMQVRLNAYTSMLRQLGKWPRHRIGFVMHLPTCLFVHRFRPNFYQEGSILPKNLQEVSVSSHPTK